MGAGATTQIREQQAADAPAVARVLAAAFADEPAVVGLEAALARRPDSTGFVAVADGEVVGHVRITRGWVDAPERAVDVMVLSPLSVAPARQRRGIGEALAARAVAEADARGAPAILLEGDPGYYSRLGWAPAADLGITPPSPRIPSAACQVVRLAGYEPWMRGPLVYADAFWEHDCVGLRGEDLARVRAALGE